MTQKAFLIFPLFWGIFFCANAQNKTVPTTLQSNVVRKEITSALVAGGISPVLNQLGKLPRERQILLFSVVIKTNKQGIIYMVDFTSKAAMLDSISYYQKVVKYLKTDKNKVFVKSKNSVYLVPVLIRDDGNYTIDATQDFLKSIADLVPLISSKPGEQLTVLPSISFNVASKE